MEQKLYEIHRLWQTLFIDIIDDILTENRNKNKAQLPKQRINCHPKTMFLHSVSNYKIVHTMKSLKDNLSAGYDEIPGYLVKQCLRHKKPTSSYSKCPIKFKHFPIKTEKSKSNASI
jgi:hypothetical protein